MIKTVLAPLALATALAAAGPSFALDAANLPSAVAGDPGSVESGPSAAQAKAMTLFAQGRREDALKLIGEDAPSQAGQILKAEFLIKMGRGDDALQALAPVELEPTRAEWRKLMVLRVCASHMAGHTLASDELLVRLAERAPRSMERIEALRCAGREDEASRLSQLAANN